MIQIVTFPGIGPSSNEFYSGIHWTARKKLADSWHVIVKACVVAQQIQPVKVCVSLMFTLVFGKGMKRYDVSNGSATAKLIEDGLVLAGILQGDSVRWVRRISLETTADRAHPTGWTRLEIVPLTLDDLEFIERDAKTLRTRGSKQR